MNNNIYLEPEIIINPQQNDQNDQNAQHNYLKTSDNINPEITYDKTDIQLQIDKKNTLFPMKNELTTNIEETNNEEYQTLDEPVCKTIKRDFFRIYNKLKHVVTPRLTSKKIEELYNYDLWGPLIFCFLLCVALSYNNDYKDNESSIYVIIFIIFWLGGIVVTFNAKFLGIKIGLCQMICLLGYCAFPITVSALIIAFLNVKTGWKKCSIVFFGYVWACLASVGFVSGMVRKDKEIIAVIPILLFYLGLALFVVNE